MKKLPLTNIDKFEKVFWTNLWSPNCEIFWWGIGNTYHYQHKNYQEEGIEIKWNDNLFDLSRYIPYVLEK